MLNDSRSPGIQPDNNEKRDEPFLIGGSGLTDDEDLKVMSNLWPNIHGLVEIAYLQGIIKTCSIYMNLV